MIVDLFRACELTGFVPRHAQSAMQVASRLDTVILFREPGKAAAGLIDEEYGMKGFRIDTKSCNWGPMAGFVCMDPRLTKEQKYADPSRNPTWTKEALTGHVVEKFFGKVEDASWVADVMPIVISPKRLAWLKSQNLISPRQDGQDLVGVSSPRDDASVVLPWRLAPVGNATNAWLAAGGATPGHYVLCVDKAAKTAFGQRYVKDVSRPISFRGHETILGLCNPGSKQRGFKACVTADYDLFSIWPRSGKGDRVQAMHAISGAIHARNGGPTPSLPGGVARMANADTRLSHDKRLEHHRFGDVSARVMMVKTALNAALMGGRDGNAVHHNDEAGNFALAKGSLMDCMPLIAFAPGWGTVAIESLHDFKTFTGMVRAAGFDVRCKPAWLTEAGIAAAPAPSSLP